MAPKTSYSFFSSSEIRSMRTFSPKKKLEVVIYGHKSTVRKVLMYTDTQGFKPHVKLKRCYDAIFLSSALQRCPSHLFLHFQFCIFHLVYHYRNFCTETNPCQTKNLKQNLMNKYNEQNIFIK